MLVTRNKYAALCGVTAKAIQDRVESGKLTTIDQQGKLFIDTEKYPPERFDYGGRSIDPAAPAWKSTVPSIFRELQKEAALTFGEQKVLVDSSETLQKVPHIRALFSLKTSVENAIKQLQAL